MTRTWRVWMGLLVCGLMFTATGVQPTMAGGGIFCRTVYGNASEQTIARFRALGPEGLAHALSEYDALHQRREKLQTDLNQRAAAGSKGKQEPIATAEDRLAGVKAQLERMAAAIDQIGGQRGCSVSRLYWYTDLDEARAAAKQSGRPILSLRMLGKLTDEFSCANSRFFRTALYSNKTVSDALRNNFVLHWQSVRPVPRVTIDFGDGRKLERTLTGNSAHYVLTASGRPLDVLPGLYSPNAFFHWLHRMNKFHAHYSSADQSEQADLLATFHSERRSQIYRQWADDIRRLGEMDVALVTSRIDRAIESATKTGGDSPLAVAASRLAFTKMQAETPLLRFANFSGPWIETGMDDPLWQRIAVLHREDVKLDQTSVEVMRVEFPKAAVAGELAVTKSRQEDPLLRVVRTFEESMALDTVRNEYLLHRRIHERFADAPAETVDVDALNEWVYARLFLTPSSDPWLGLAPADVYTALEDDGRTQPTASVAHRPGG